MKNKNSQKWYLFNCRQLQHHG